MPPLAAAAVSGVASIVGGAISASASKKAANKAADISAANNAANIAATEKTRAENKAVLDPYLTIGQSVNPLISSLLGYGGDPNAGKVGLATFREATGYQDQLTQGMGAVTNNAATSGLLGSGATIKALQERGNNLASGSFGGYLSALIGQQNTGLTAASAFTGVNNTANSQIITSNNANAETSANAALTRAGINNANIANITSTLGGLSKAVGTGLSGKLVDQYGLSGPASLTNAQRLAGYA